MVTTTKNLLVQWYWYACGARLNWMSGMLKVSPYSGILAKCYAVCKVDQQAYKVSKVQL